MAMRSSFERYLEHAFNSRIRNGVGLEQLLKQLSAASGVDEERLKPVAHKFAESFWDQAKETVLNADGPLSAVELEVKTLKQRLLQCNLSATKGVAAARAARHALAHRPSIEADAVVFHESLHHLDEETRNLVLSIVLEKLWLFKRGLAPPSLVEALRKYAADVSLPLGYEDLEEMQARLITEEEKANKAQEELVEAEERVQKFDKGFNKLRSDHNYLRQKLGLNHVEAEKYIKEEESEVDETESQPGYDPEVDEALDLQDPSAINALRAQLQQSEQKRDGMYSPNNESRWTGLYKGQKSGLPLTRMQTQTSSAMLDSPTEQSNDSPSYQQSPGGRRRSATGALRSPTDEVSTSSPQAGAGSLSRGHTSEWQVPPTGERRFSRSRRRASDGSGQASPEVSPTQSPSGHSPPRRGSAAYGAAAPCPRGVGLAKQMSVAFDDQGHVTRTGAVLDRMGAASSIAASGGRGLNKGGTNEIKIGPVTLVINDDSGTGGFLGSEAGQGVVAAIGSWIQRFQSKMSSVEQAKRSGAELPSGRATSPSSPPSNTKHPRRGSAELATPGSAVALSSNDGLATGKGPLGGGGGGGSASKLSTQQQDLLLQTMLESCIELSDEFRGEASSTQAAQHRSAIAAALKSLVQKKASPQLAEMVASYAAGDAEASKALVAEMTGSAKHCESVACQTDVCRFAMETTERQAAEGKQLKVVLKDTHGKAKQLVDRAQERGIGKQVNEIVEEIGFVAVGKSRSVFERLYADAVAHFDEHWHPVHHPVVHHHGHPHQQPQHPPQQQQQQQQQHHQQPQHKEHQQLHQQPHRSPYAHHGTVHHSPAEELASQLAQHNAAHNRLRGSKSLSGHVSAVPEEHLHRTSASSQHASHGVAHHGAHHASSHGSTHHAAPSAPNIGHTTSKTLKSLTSSFGGHQEDAPHEAATQKKVMKSLTSSYTAHPQDTSPRRSSGEERRRSSTGEHSPQPALRHRIHSTLEPQGAGSPVGRTLSEAQALLSAASAPALPSLVQDHHQHHHRSSVPTAGAQHGQGNGGMDRQLMQALEQVAASPEGHSAHSAAQPLVHRSSTSTVKPFAALAPGGMSPCTGEGALRRTTSKALSLPRLPRTEHSFVKDEATVNEALGIKSVRTRPRQWG